MTIGIPKALLYYENEILYKEFFNKLNIKTIISPDTNLEILNNGKNISHDEACLSLKIYLGHINYLINKCDYILIPRITSLNKNEKMCTNFYALYDLVNNNFNTNLLEYNIDKHNPKIAFLKLGKKLGFNYYTSLKAYNYAKEKELEDKNNKIITQNKLLESNHKKILIIGASYTVYDKLIGEPIINYIKDNNIEVILGNIYDEQNLDQEYINISTDIYFTYHKKLLGALSCYKDKVNGIILITSFPCGPSSLTNDLIIRRIKDKPILNLNFDDLNSNTGIITRLESFIDIIKGEIYE